MEHSATPASPLDSSPYEAWSGITPRSRSEGPPEVLPDMVGDAACMHRLARSVQKLAWLAVPVLIRGESGTGKELVARALHQLGPRGSGPFVAINSATLDDTLASSALFGHARGAFTGASEARQGAFRRADGGTLFIDEIGSLPPSAQAALLRAVEEGQVTPVGGDRPTPVDVRLVVATCEPLEHMVQRGRFRGDLYQRLSACIVRVPPLRERLSDIPHLVRHAIETTRLGIRSVDAAGIALLKRQIFPGNVRELRNVLTQAALAADGPVLGASDVADALAARSTRALATEMAPDQVLQILDRAGNNVSRAARQVGVPRTTFRDWVNKARARRSEGARDAEPLLVRR